MRTLPFFILPVSVFILVGCATQRSSTITGSDYDESNDQTKYFVVPYGSVELPGKWSKTHYNSISHQQFFTNNDTILIAIAFNRYNKYEFNQKGEKQGFEFLKAFYEWDSKYFVDAFHLNRRLIESDSLNNYVLYNIYDSLNIENLNTYFLIGEKNGNVSSMSINRTNKWSENEKIAFLKELYMN